jgi:hypothetical protein
MKKHFKFTALLICLVICLSCTKKPPEKEKQSSKNNFSNATFSFSPNIKILGEVVTKREIDSMVSIYIKRQILSSTAKGSDINLNKETLSLFIDKESLEKVLGIDEGDIKAEGLMAFFGVEKDTNSDKHQSIILIPITKHESISNHYELNVVTSMERWPGKPGFSPTLDSLDNEKKLNEYFKKIGIR